MKRGREGSVLVGLLWCLVLLSMVVIGILHSSRIDLLISRRQGDVVQARYLAWAAIERATALLYQDSRERMRSARNHTGSLYDAPDRFREVRMGRGSHRVIRAATAEEGAGLIYGVSDEEGRLNVNIAAPEELAKAEGITPDLVAAMVDWRDGDDRPTDGGAEVEAYATLRPPSKPRNGPFLTLREVGMVRGMRRELLFGSDTHQTGLEERAVSGGEGGREESEWTTVADRGWAGGWTVDSRVENRSASGEDRVNVQSADETALSGVSGITREVARAIVAYRGQNSLESLADLLEVTAAREGAPGAGPGPGEGQGGPRGGGRPGGGGNQGGAKVIDEELLLEIADGLSVTSDAEQPGLVNVNTAPLEVLLCLPGMTRELAQSLISYRASSGFLPNIAYLLRVPGLSREVFKQLSPRVTVRSETFRILGEGRVSSTGVRQRIQAVVHVGMQDVTLLSYREDDL